MKKIQKLTSQPQILDPAPRYTLKPRYKNPLYNQLFATRDYYSGFSFNMLIRQWFYFMTIVVGNFLHTFSGYLRILEASKDFWRYFQASLGLLKAFLGFLRLSKARLGFFTPGFEYIHPQLTLNPYSVTFWHLCSPNTIPTNPSEGTKSNADAA